MDVVAVVFLPEKFNSPILYFLRLFLGIIKGVKSCKVIGVRGYFRAISILSRMSSAWINDVMGKAPYMHLDMLVVQENFRGKKLSTEMMKYILTECDTRGLPCTLETQNPKNVSIYGHFGFEVVKTIKMKNSDLEQYCMVYYPKKQICY